jgi:hypothetical protein
MLALASSSAASCGRPSASSSSARMRRLVHSCGHPPPAAQLMQQIGEHPQRFVVAAEPDQGGDERDARDLGDLRGTACLGLGRSEFEDLDRSRGFLEQPDLTHRVRREGPDRTGIPRDGQSLLGVPPSGRRVGLEAGEQRQRGVRVDPQRRRHAGNFEQLPPVTRRYRVPPAVAAGHPERLQRQHRSSGVDAIASAWVPSRCDSSGSRPAADQACPQDTSVSHKVWGCLRAFAPTTARSRAATAPAGRRSSRRAMPLSRDHVFPAVRVPGVLFCRPGGALGRGGTSQVLLQQHDQGTLSSAFGPLPPRPPGAGCQRSRAPIFGWVSSGLMFWLRRNRLPGS